MPTKSLLLVGIAESNIEPLLLGLVLLPNKPLSNIEPLLLGFVPQPNLLTTVSNCFSQVL